MVGASKILTVSYGTFSCTLEGFEDSFGTMKAIAEYFRDLAADDRYFGAEPPTPDAEMLQRIAEREIRKRVDARVGDEGVVLRPAALTAEPDLYAAPPRTDTALPPSALVGGPAKAAPARPDEPESVAAKLARIRAVVENARGAAPAEIGEPDAFALPDADEVDTEDHAPREAAPSSPKSPDPAAEAPEEDPEPVAEARIRASDDVDEPGPTLPDDTAADDPVADPTANVLSKLATLTRAADGAGDTPAQPRARARVLKLKREDLAARWPAAETPAAAPLAAVAKIDEAARLPDDLEAELQADLAAALSEAEAETAGSEAADTLATARAEDAFLIFGAAEEEASETADATGDVVEDAREDTAQEPEETETHAEIEETEAVTAEDEVAADEETATEDADDEADKTVSDVVAAVSRALHAADDDAPQGGTPRRDGSVQGVETSLERLFDETNSKLDGADQKRRRASIAHLKAAVAATFADRRPEDTNAEEERERRPYRQVLAKVVRGNRDDKPASERPAEPARLAPLMLVSEQRVDMPRPDPVSDTAAIRPRRVTAGPAETAEDDAPVGNIFAAEISFDDFADRRGAAGVADTLEAAAAYVMTVEEHDSFSRPHILRLAMSRLDPDTNREEVLRAFGSLLRIGTFRKVKRGNFVMAGLDSGEDEDARRQA